MSRSVRQWLRDDPVFTQMCADVVNVGWAWPAALVVAHRDESTGKVTFHLHVRPGDKPRLHELLGNVPLREMHSGTGTTYHFHGGRQDMDRLIRRLKP